MDVQAVREQFPILNQRIHGRSLIYLDNAATLQMPERVLESITMQYRAANGNVHRGVHTLSQRSTQRMEWARQVVADYIDAAPEEIVFTSGTTDSINLLAKLLEPTIDPGSQIIVSGMEHHSNLLPWQEVCRNTGAELVILQVNEAGEVSLEELEMILKKKTALVAVTWVSNLLGTINPIREITQMAHRAGAVVCVDGAQGMKQADISTRKADYDFLAFSGHKLGSLTGIGVLYGKKERLENLYPVRFGGGMIASTGYYDFQPGNLPQCFEAGTPNYTGAISLGEALCFLQEIGIEKIQCREEELTALVVKLLQEIDSVHVLGNPDRRSGAVSFAVKGVHPFDLGSLLDAQGIAVRTGHMCAQPLVEHLGYTSVLRVSPAFYNTREELSVMQDTIRRGIEILRGKRG